MADEPVYYWDACILLEHFRGEAPSPNKIRAIRNLLDENARHENRIITSTITHIEVLPKKLNQRDAAKEAEYWTYYDGRWFLDVEPNRNIINLAREIKDFYYEPDDPVAGKGHRMMSTGDAIHLATAIVYEVDVLHTRDGKRKGGNVPILGLPKASPNGKIAGRWDLKIESPEDEQGDLLDPRSEPLNDEAATTEAHAEDTEKAAE